MSAKYSTSPGLHLAIAESHIRRWLVRGFLLAFAAALFELWRCGQVVWAVAGVVPLAALALHTRRQPEAGSHLIWRAGRWQLEDGGRLQDIDILRGHCLSWVTFIAWRDARGKRGQAWLFPDSAGRESLRRLRVRLSLERAI